MLKLSVIMAACNERETIEAAVEGVLSLDLAKELIVVDNCSDDGTREYVESMEADGLRVILQERNLGKGHSIRTALPYCRGTWTVIQDADLEYDPASLPVLLEAIESQGWDAAYGSRVLGGHPALYEHYYWGVRLLTSLTNAAFGCRLTDVATASKMVRTDIFRSLDLKGNGFDLDFELTNKLARRGCRIGEIPIAYTPRSFEEGKKIRARDGLRALFTIARDRLSRDAAGQDGP